MSLINDIKHLRSVSLFSAFTDDQLRLLAFGSETLVFPSQSQIFINGQTANGGYYLIEGEVELLIDGPNAKERRITIEAGSLIGEMAMFTRNKRIGTAIVKTDCKLLHVSRTTIVRVLQEYPELAADIHDRIKENINSFAKQLDVIEAGLCQPE